MLYAYNQVPSNTNSSPYISFIWDNENYLTKIKSDSDFLKEHSISKLFNFSEKNDPFLVIPS